MRLDDKASIPPAQARPACALVSGSPQTTAQACPATLFDDEARIPPAQARLANGPSPVCTQSPTQARLPLRQPERLARRHLPPPCWAKRRSATPLTSPRAERRKPRSREVSGPAATPRPDSTEHHQPQQPPQVHPSTAKQPFANHFVIIIFISNMTLK